jgi:hypothetical protein
MLNRVPDHVLNDGPLSIFSHEAVLFAGLVSQLICSVEHLHPFRLVLQLYKQFAGSWRSTGLTTAPNRQRIKVSEGE